VTHLSVDLSEIYRGHVRIWNEAGLVVTGHNDVVYSGGDILAHLAAGDSQYRISHFYFEYENTAGAPVAGTVSRSDTAASRQGVSAPYDLIRAPLVATPILTPSDVNHLSNQATFYALTTASVGAVNGLPFTSGADSKIYAMCMVAAPGGSDRLQDRLYARWILSTVVPVAGSGLVSGAWLAEWV
jgi:hypothetical protein